MEAQANGDSPELAAVKLEPLMTVTETAKQLSISESYLRHLIQRKEIPGVVRIGRAVRFDPQVLRNYRTGLLENASQR
jgi:excisionase family DNA binding protein